jgi:Mlc titration factor MtfA (ptsG expression regulator)
MFGFKRRRRRRLRAQPLPPGWLAVLAQRVPYYHRLTPDDQAELRGHIQVLLAEKRFEGCGGVEVTDEMRVMIGAQAALLLLNRDTDYFPKTDTILIYPDRYYAETTQRLPGGVVAEGVTGRAGESWYRGPVVLSWTDVRAGADRPAAGRNVVLHEFAHQLDSESGAVEGAPALPKRSMYADWQRVLGGEYERLVDDLRHGRPTLINPYGATSPAEFFAVVTEAFFELPIPLQRRHPDLYEQFRLYYRQDPVTRFTPAVSPFNRNATNPPLAPGDTPPSSPGPSRGD